jgi:hypothetical protein
MTGSPPIPHLVVVGAACRDIVPDDPRGWRLGGGAPYSTLAAARLGVRTATLLGVDGLAASAAELEMVASAGATIEPIALERGPVFENIERPGGRVQYCRQPSDRVPSSALPALWAYAPAWIFAPVADELGDEWATVPAADAIVAVGWQGLLRELVAGERVGRRVPWPSPIIRRADVVGVSHHDLGPETPIDELLAMLKPGASLLLTKGAEGGIVWRRRAGGRTTARRYPAFEPDRVVDATGAGDTFLAALIVSWLDPELARARRRGGDLRFASAAGSLVVEGPGLDAVPDRDAVTRRARRSRGTGAPA